MLGAVSPQERSRTSAQWIGAPARQANGVATTAMLAAMSSHALARGAARGGPATISCTGARGTMSVRAPSTPTPTHSAACASYRAGDSRRHVLRGRQERGRTVRRLLRPCRSARTHGRPDDCGRPLLLLRRLRRWLLPLAQVRDMPCALSSRDDHMRLPGGRLRALTPLHPARRQNIQRRIAQQNYQQAMAMSTRPSSSVPVAQAVTLPGQPVAQPVGGNLPIATGQIIAPAQVVQASPVTSQQCVPMAHAVPLNA